MKEYVLLRWSYCCATSQAEALMFAVGATVSSTVAMVEPYSLDGELLGVV